MNGILEKAKSLDSATCDASDLLILYDELLWAIATAPAKELTDAGEKIYNVPLLNIPRPLQVVLLRLAALTANDNATKNTCLDLLASLCDPFDEAIIISPLRGKNE
jgi:hypothetical protein